MANSGTNTLPARHPGTLPPRLKVLSVTTAQNIDSWLSAAFAADSATEIVLTEVVGATAGAAKLRDEVYDVILVTHAPGQLDALEFVEGLRAGGTEEPLIVLGSLPTHELDAFCFEVGADDYCCVADTTIRGLLWKFMRAIERKDLLRENRRLVRAHEERLKREHLEAQRLLEQQRHLIADLETLGKPDATNTVTSLDHLDDFLARTANQHSQQPHNLSPALVSHYRELLRTYVIMGVGNLGTEMARLVEMLVAAEVSAHNALQLHVAILEELVQGLGTRSARHVINRGDLLALEVMSHLADRYRERIAEDRHPLRQQVLPFAA